MGFAVIHVQSFDYRLYPNTSRVLITSMRAGATIVSVKTQTIIASAIRDGGVALSTRIDPANEG